MSLFALAYKICQKVAKPLGFDLVLSKHPKNKHSYERIFPNATYAPWLNDSVFLQVYESIKTHTLVDKYRCYEMWQLVNEVQHIKGSFIEIGVWRGGTGVLTAKRMKLLGIDDPIFLCDTFEGVVKAGIEDKYYKGGEHSDTSKEKVELLAKELGVDNTSILVGMFPEATASSISNINFRFCHIDVDVYQSAKDIVDWIWPKLSVGGIIVFDDYGFETCDGIAKYIDELRGTSGKVIVQNLNGHALIIKTH